jgi:hypothetical protein
MNWFLPSAPRFYAKKHLLFCHFLSLNELVVTGDHTNEEKHTLYSSIVSLLA